MSKFIAPIISCLEVLATKIPLELFTIVGTITEEVVAPIPSPLVMTLTGAIAKAQDFALSYIFFLAILGAFGKTIGAWIIYFIADKAEDIFIGKFGKFFGVSHKDVENMGAKFDGTKKDIWTIGILRAIPVMSTAIVSVACGVIKVNLKNYLIASFFGNIIRNLFFLYIGFTGLAASDDLAQGIESTETFLQFAVIGILGTLLSIGYMKRGKKEKHEQVTE
jgi:membrane protein DedA with SNARE-associated domain